MIRMIKLIIDKLYESVENKGNVCVGLDTAVNYLPPSFSEKFTSVENALFQFNKQKIGRASCRERV